MFSSRTRICYFVSQQSTCCTITTARSVYIIAMARTVSRRAFCCRGLLSPAAALVAFDDPGFQSRVVNTTICSTRLVLSSSSALLTKGRDCASSDCAPAAAAAADATTRRTSSYSLLLSMVLRSTEQQARAWRLSKSWTCCDPDLDLGRRY